MTRPPNGWLAAFAFGVLVWTLLLGGCSLDAYLESMEHITCDVGETPAESRRLAIKRITGHGYFLLFEPVPDRSWAPENPAGFTSPVSRTVWVDPSFSARIQLETLWHESVHVVQFFDGLGVTKEWRAARELQADKQAAVADAKVGMDLQPMMDYYPDDQDLLWSAIEECE